MRAGRNLVIEAPPGAGKTTRVPPALLSLNFGEVLVLEPRRLAARMAARRVASEMGERAGETVGYQVRFEDVSGPGTRLRFLTEGVLVRTIVSQPDLRKAGVVVLDEFHERHLDTDLSLALLRHVQKTSRPDLRIVVMSATMDAAPVARFLGDCPVLRCEGRLHDLAISYTPHSPQSLEEQIAAGVEKLVGAGLDGDVLVFLPGAAEIRRTARALEGIARRADLRIAPLHGDLPPDEQDRAVAPAERPKLILSTNVAESSITIEGVSAVIDSGLARLASDSPWTGLPRLEVARVSKASATQRAGRAGRTRPGRVIRLYSADDFHRRPAHDSPEILRRELAQTCLTLHALGLSRLDWLEAPPAAAIEAAEDLLRALGAADGEGRLTRLGREMTRYPLHPRLAKLAIEGGRDGATLAALLSAGERLPASADQAGPSDLLLLLEAEWLPRSRQLVEQIRRVRGAGVRPAQNLLETILTAFPDRVARRRQGNDLLLSTGGAAILAPQSAVRSASLMVAVDIEDRPDQGAPLVRLASAIEPEWLLDRYPERLRSETRVEWNRAAERVEGVEALYYDKLAIEESRAHNPDPEGAARLLAEKALETGIGRFADQEAINEFLARVEFASAHGPIPKLTDADLRTALEDLCIGLRSLQELESAAFDRALEHRLPAAARSQLTEIAPERLRLPSGRSARVRYVKGQAPWVASRLQDFFGLRETPRIARGQVPLVVHLLAPSRRPVQVTTDLAGFW
ncbi:MAG: ATP-dependent helicase HrpB, partial [Bryobacteraceae bacterium]